MDFNLTTDQIKLAAQKYDDLRIQSMMFDMDIDIETWGLVPKVKKVDDKPWLTKWLNKQAESDYTVYDNGN